MVRAQSRFPHEAALPTWKCLEMHAFIRTPYVEPLEKKIHFKKGPLPGLEHPPERLIQVGSTLLSHDRATTTRKVGTIHPVKPAKRWEKCLRCPRPLAKASESRIFWGGQQDEGCHAWMVWIAVPCCSKDITKCSKPLVKLVTQIFAGLWPNAML